jgi:membrane associated rhomboid family serine protease
MDKPHSLPRDREPVFNLPGVVAGLLGVLILVQILRSFVPETFDMTMLLWLSFIPARYAQESPYLFPGGEGAAAWSFITYAFLHGDWTHLAVNAVWLAAFGSGLARRFGAARFLLFSGACAVAGAGAHLISHWGELVPMVGASAAISGQMAAAARYAFRFGGIGGHDDEAFRGPALPLGAMFADPRVLAFLGVWFFLNLVFGAGLVPLTPDGPAIAWEAHIGGFLVGLLGFTLFDPVRRRIRPHVGHPNQ